MVRLALSGLGVLSSQKSGHVGNKIEHIKDSKP